MTEKMEFERSQRKLKTTGLIARIFAWTGLVVCTAMIPSSVVSGAAIGSAITFGIGAAALLSGVVTSVVSEGKLDEVTRKLNAVNSIVDKKVLQPVKETLQQSVRLDNKPKEQDNSKQNEK